MSHSTESSILTAERFDPARGKRLSIASFGIAAAEALCCGCSVVAGESVSMASFAWFVSENSGRLSATDDVQGHARALRDELHEWDRGGRDPAAISAIWARRLHTEKVAEKVASMVENHLRHRRHC